MTSATDTRRALTALAANQGSYLTARQALAVGYPYPEQHYHVAHGDWERIARGIFRRHVYPLPEREDLIVLSVMTHNRSGQPQAVFSHETALALHDLGDANPVRIHLTVPPGFCRALPLRSWCIAASFPRTIGRNATATGSPRRCARSWTSRPPPRVDPPWNQRYVMRSAQGRCAAGNCSKRSSHKMPTPVWWRLLTALSRRQALSALFLNHGLEYAGKGDTGGAPCPSSWPRAPVDAGEARQVRKLAHSVHAPADWIVHAQVIVRSWDGRRTRQIVEEPGCHPQTVRERLHAFNARGLDGLGMKPGAGRKPRLTEEERSTILALVKRPLPGKPTSALTGELAAPDSEAESEWTLDTLTAAAHERGIQVARSQVRRIFRHERVRWRRTRLWATSKDPDFVPKGPGSSRSTRTRRPRRPSSASTSSVP